MEHKQRFQYTQAKRRENVDSRKSPRKSSFASSSTETHDGRNNSLTSRLLRTVSGDGTSQGPTDWIDRWNSQSNNIPAVTAQEENSTHPMQLKCKRGWTAQDWIATKSESDSLHRRKSVPSKLESSMDLESEMSSLRTELLRLRSDNTLLCNHVTLQLQSILSDKKSSERDVDAYDGNQNSNMLEIRRLSYEYEFKAQIANMLRSTITKLKSGRSATTLTQGIKSLLSKHNSQRQRLDSHESLYDCLSSKKSQRSTDTTAIEYEISRLENHLKLLVDALEDERQVNHELIHEIDHLKSKMETYKSSGKLKNGMHSPHRRR
eukprot:g4507.t1